MPFGKCPEQNLPLAAGETLVLYTDGLIERRAVPLTDSMAQLLDVVRDATSAEEVCQLAFEELVPAEGVRDDVALVAVRNEEIPTELRLRLPAEARILADMRRALRRWLRHRADAGEQDIVEVTMAVNEACANAIEHAYTPMPAEFELCASFADGEVAVVISDVGHWRSPRGVHRGRGRTIMESAMDGVKVEAGPAGTRVALRRRMRR
jgi:anti-sigma regulatory factor (Ser/Thr protein kinase)